MLRGKTKPSRGRASSPWGRGPNGSFPTQGRIYGSSKYPILSAPFDDATNKSTANCPTFPTDKAGWFIAQIVTHKQK